MAEKVVALAGNPNVGKSTLFNALTGMNQHTGNWSGKTVSNAFGKYTFNDNSYTIVDLPGTYSLLVSSKEEAQARNFLLEENSDAVVVVIDATCLERNLNLVLQVLEITDNVIVCVNLLDEAEKKKIKIDIDELSLYLGIPVIGMCARKGVGLDELKQEVETVINHNRKYYPTTIKYDNNIEENINRVIPYLTDICPTPKLQRYFALRLLENDEYVRTFLDENINSKETKDYIENFIYENKDFAEKFRDNIVETIIKKCEYIYNKVVTLNNPEYNLRDRKIDKILTSKITGIPIMLLLLAFIFWLTIIGANYPSQWLSNIFDWLYKVMTNALDAVNTPQLITGMLMDGIYKTTAWVVSVMLPPMAIFFPLFTLLEDSGYLPRIAFNMDSVFQKANCHGKQMLSMCMGFGCNACGVTGCRIIDSPRERLIAIITNSFVPCNGRFPGLITLITLLFTGVFLAPVSSVYTTLVLMLVILLGIFMTFLVSKFLSTTILKGESSSFTLELPPYRKPQIGKIIIRSIFDRTIFVLGRAVAVAAPAGLIIWLLTNIKVNDLSLISYCTEFIDPFAQLFGMDGVILIAFILGFPANEIVIPIMIMLYTQNSVLTESDNLAQLYTLFISNGWSIVTVICVIIFYLMHFPCSTTCISIYKETKSIKWTLVSFFTPLICGLSLCFIVSATAKVVGF